MRCAQITNSPFHKVFTLQLYMIYIIFFSIFHQENRILSETNDELHAQLLNAGIEEGRNLLHTGDAASIASEIEEMSKDEVRKLIAYFNSLMRENLLKILVVSQKVLTNLIMGP